MQRNTSRQSKPLRVQVMHSSVVAHQCFALKALHWLGHVIGYSGQSPSTRQTINVSIVYLPLDGALRILFKYKELNTIFKCLSGVGVTRVFITCARGPIDSVCVCRCSEEDPVSGGPREGARW